MSRRTFTVAMLGPGFSPHVTRMAAALAARGHRLHIVSEDKFMPFPDVMGVTFHAYPAAASLPARARDVRRILKSIRPEVVHSHAVNHGGYMAVASGFHPHVMTAWGSDILLHPKRSLRARVETGIALRAADWLLSDSSEIRDAMDALGLHPAHNEILQFGVDVKHFTPQADGAAFRAKLGVAPGVPLAFSPRVFGALYNQDVMIEAWPAVLAKVPTAKLAVLRYHPEAEYEGRVRARAAALGIESSILWTEPLTYAELPQAYAGSDAVISIPSSDGTPVTVLEAMACGAQVAACDLPALRDWVIPGKNGRLVPPRDAHRLAEAVSDLLTASPERRQAAANYARNTILARADRERCLDRLEAVYAAAAGRGFSFLKTARNLAGR